MNAPIQSDSPLRQTLLDQIAAITTMQPGALAEEYREHPDPSGQGVVRRGPYFKYQIWRDGHNLSRRVPADEAATLKLDIDNAKRFHQLTAQLAQLNIEHTLALRGTQTAAAHVIAEKKTSKPNASPKNTAKRNTSSPRPAKSSPTGKRSKT
jgi:hypothetical protein